MAARKLTRQHRWLALAQLSKAWNPTDTTALFDDCFGKMSESEFARVKDALPLEHRIAAVFAQLEIPLPTLESTRRARNSLVESTPSLHASASRPASRIGSDQPTPVNMSSTALNSVHLSEEDPLELVISYLDSIDALQEESLIWRILIFADHASISRLSVISPELTLALKATLSSCSSISWIVNAFVGLQ